MQAMVAIGRLQENDAIGARRPASARLGLETADRVAAAPENQEANRVSVSWDKTWRADTSAGYAFRSFAAIPSFARANREPPLWRLQHEQTALQTRRVGPASPDINMG